jgi:hypothetical protein
MTVRAAFFCCGVLVALCWPAAAHADLPAWLRTENGDVQEGNEKLAKGDAKGALAAYDRAARALPESPGVSLDRGLALLKLGEFAKAKEALQSAASPSAPTALRADAYQNLALSYYREADALATQKKHDEAQRLFRESVDAAKRSLRMRPGDPNAAWNLELAARRVREEEQKQKQEDDQKKQDDKNKNQDQKNDQGQDKQDPKQDGSPGDQQKPQDGKQDQSKPDQKKPEDDAKSKQDKSDAQKKAQEQAAAQKKRAEEQPAQGQQKQGDKDKPAPEKPIPSEVKQALDSLQDGEENFERVRARQRAAQERRAPEKDW